LRAGGSSSPTVATVDAAAALCWDRAQHAKGRQMTVKVGDRVPSVTLRYVTPDGVQAVSTDDFFRGKKVALFAVPGAFTRTCSQRHLPSYVTNAAELKAKGIDTIACIAVNDQFVMSAWGREHGAGDDIVMLGDGSGDFTKAMGLELDRVKEGMGIRSQRYSMLVDDGVIKALNVEQPGVFEVSSAETMLKAL
jgi:glutaredoxin/glutathione-dependent peroxiredoxin